MCQALRLVCKFWKISQFEVVGINLLTKPLRTTAPSSNLRQTQLCGNLPLACLDRPRVGNINGVATPTRRNILDAIFERELPPMPSEDYMNQWGKPKSSVRLQKMAETLAALTRNAKRKRTARMQTSIKSWEADLKYLYEGYYVDHFHFDWPSSRIDLARFEP